jgi:hypothetical protein
VLAVCSSVRVRASAENCHSECFKKTLIIDYPPFLTYMLFLFPSFLFSSLLTLSYLEDEYHARKNGDIKDRDKTVKDEKNAFKEIQDTGAGQQKGRIESSEGSESTEDSQKDRCDKEGSSEEKEGSAEHSLALNLPVPPSPVPSHSASSKSSSASVAGAVGTEEKEENDKDKKEKQSALTSIKATSISMPHFKCNVRILLYFLTAFAHDLFFFKLYSPVLSCPVLSCPVTIIIMTAS